MTGEVIGIKDPPSVCRLAIEFPSNLYPVVPGDVSFDSGKFFPLLAVLSKELISAQADGSDSNKESSSGRRNVLKGDMSPWFVDKLP